MTTPTQPSRPDRFDQLLAEYPNSTHEYEDHDADLRDVLRPWSKLSAEGKLAYIARAAALYNVPFERFDQAAREMLDGQALPAGEHAYLRLHMQCQRALWDAELPAFPREQPVPKDDPHHDFLDSLDGVLHLKFERLLDDYLNAKQSFADTDGQMRRWTELSADGKVEHIARLAAIFNISLSRFTEATIATGLLEAARAVIARGTAVQNRSSPHSLRDALFSETASQPEPQPEPNHERHHKR